MKLFVFAFSIAVSVLLVAGARSQTSSAKLEIHVVKRTYGDGNPKPFVGVGVFDLQRGKSKFEGASCPDKSGAGGAINCSIPCQADQETPITIRVKPPSDQDHLAGWVTPAAQDVELRGCKLVPQLITMKYDDAKYALNDFLLSKYAFASPNTGKGQEPWIDIFKSNPKLAAEVAASAKASANGRSDLFNIYRLASESSKAYMMPTSKLSASETEESRALTKWQILSKSALLTAQWEKTVPQNERGNIKIVASDDIASYVANLKNADGVLSNIKNKTPDQLKLADDIKTLRSMPVTGKDALDALPIIQEWK